MSLAERRISPYVPQRIRTIPRLASWSSVKNTSVNSRTNKDLLPALRTQISTHVEASSSGSSATPADNRPPDDLVELGIFGPPHGVYGELRLQAITDSIEERLRQAGPRWAIQQKGRGKKDPIPLVIENVRSTIAKGRATWLVKVEGVDSMEEAEQLRGHMLSMSGGDRPELDDEDEFYAQELIGMRVFLESSGEEIGTVADVFSGTGSHDLLRVVMDKEEGEEPSRAPVAMVPFAKEIVRTVHRVGRKLGIDPPEGLLNIQAMLKNNSTPKKKGPKAGKKRNRNPAVETRTDSQEVPTLSQ